jgi:hypothetical protein
MNGQFSGIYVGHSGADTLRSASAVDLSLAVTFELELDRSWDMVQVIFFF